MLGVLDRAASRHRSHPDARFQAAASGFRDTGCRALVPDRCPLLETGNSNWRLEWRLHRGRPAAITVSLGPDLAGLPA